VGYEVWCEARFGEKVSEGKALLESDELIFRGDFRLSIPLKSVKSVNAKNGWLEVAFAGELARFNLGHQAERWAIRISNPKSLIDKLGVKPDFKIAVLGIKNEEFWKHLIARAGDVQEGSVGKNLDIIFLLAESKNDLKKLEPLKNSIKRSGAIWVVTPKGKDYIKEGDVITEGRRTGLVDVKVVGFSETHTAHKFVIPLNGR
jgi:hypothetical protein